MPRLINPVATTSHGSLGRAILAMLLVGTLASCSSLQGEPTLSAADTAASSEATASAAQPLQGNESSQGQQAQQLTDAQRQSQHAAMQAITERRYADAVNLLKPLADPHSQYMTAVCWYRLQQFDLASSSLSTLLNAYANHAPALNLRGLVAKQQGLYRQAERDFLAAIAATPSFAPAERNLGILYELYLANPSQAALHYQRYVELTGDKTVERWQQALPQSEQPASSSQTPLVQTTEPATELNPATSPQPPEQNPQQNKSETP